MTVLCVVNGSDQPTPSDPLAPCGGTIPVASIRAMSHRATCTITVPAAFVAQCWSEHISRAAGAPLDAQASSMTWTPRRRHRHRLLTAPVACPRGRAPRAHPGMQRISARMPSPPRAAAVSSPPCRALLEATCADRLLSDVLNAAASPADIYRDRWLSSGLRACHDELHRRRAVVYGHPTAPDCCRNLLPGIPDWVIEFPADTTRTIASLLFSGTIARCGGIRFVFAHLGGILPVVADHLARAAEVDAALAAAVPAGVRETLRGFHYAPRCVCADRLFAALRSPACRSGCFAPFAAARSSPLEASCYDHGIGIEKIEPRRAACSIVMRMFRSRATFTHLATRCSPLRHTPGTASTSIESSRAVLRALLASARCFAFR